MKTRLYKTLMVTTAAVMVSIAGTSAAFADNVNERAKTEAERVAHKAAIVLKNDKRMQAHWEEFVKRHQDRPSLDLDKLGITVDALNQAKALVTLLSNELKKYPVTDIKHVTINLTEKLIYITVKKDGKETVNKVAFPAEVKLTVNDNVLRKLMGVLLKRYHIHVKG